MPTYGVQPTGFVGKPATDSKAAFDQAFKDIYGASLGSDPGGAIPAASSIGQEIAILVESESGAWEELLALWSAFDPNQAGDTALEILCALTGTRRKGATYSTALVTCVGTAGTVLLAGRVVTVEELGTRFASTQDATLLAGGALAVWATSTGYAVNALVTANGTIWQCVVAGTSAGAGGGPAGSFPSQVADGGVLWQAVGPDTKGVAIVPYRAEQTGPLSATALQLNQIATPVGGWNYAFNALPATLGRNLETNAALRARRVQELQAQGGGPADSIRARLLELENVEQVVVFVNSGNVVDGIGTPAHGVQILILDSVNTAEEDQALAEAIWRVVGAGTATGNAIGTPVTKSVTDASGNVQTVKFSRPTEIQLHVQATVYYDPTKWAAANPAPAIIAAVQSALMTFAEGYYLPGFDVRVLPLAATVRDGPQSVQSNPDGSVTPIYPAPAGSTATPGVVDVAMQIKKTGGVYGTSPVVIAAGEIAVFDPTRITITPSPLAP